MNMQRKEPFMIHVEDDMYRKAGISMHMEAEVWDSH